MPMLHVSEPQYAGAARLSKRLFDFVGALAAARGCRACSSSHGARHQALQPGPVFYRQERIGRHGERFGMIKFRSMAVDADSSSLTLLALKEVAGGASKMPGPAGHARRALHPTLLDRRAPAVAQRRQGRHEPGRPAAAARLRGRAVRPRCDAG